MCDCCDHPLEHVILTALHYAENLGPQAGLDALEHGLQFWREGDTFFTPEPNPNDAGAAERSDQMASYQRLK